MTIRSLLGSEIGKAISGYGYVRMHPSAAAKMLSTERGHLIVTTRFEKGRGTPNLKTFYRFSYDMGNRLYAAFVHKVFGSTFVRDAFNSDDPKEEKLGDAIEIVLGLLELWDSAPQCIPAKLEGQVFVNAIRRGVEEAPVNFCASGECQLSSKNRKMNKRKGLTEIPPENMHGFDNNLDYFIPDDEEEDYSPFTDLLNDAGEPQEEEEDEDEGPEEMVDSSTEEADEEKEASPEDDPMGEGEDEPDTKKRKVEEVVKSVNLLAEQTIVCLACGEQDHTFRDCPNVEEREKVSNAFSVLLSKVKSASPKSRRSRPSRGKKTNQKIFEDTPEKMPTLYPTEISMFDKCAEFRDGHWAILGSLTKDIGPASHEVINQILPQMPEHEGGPEGLVFDIGDIPSQYYLDLKKMFPVGIRCRLHQKTV